METFQTLIKEMNRLGMIVDLSHSSVQVTGHPHPKWKLDFSSDRPWHFGDLGCSCDFLALLCSSIVQLGTKRTWPTPQADGTCFFPPWDFFSVSSFQAAKKGLVMINFFSYFITCSNVSSITDVIGRPSRILEGAFQYLSCSTYQPREGGCGNRLRGYRSQLRRHQCVSNRFTRARLYASYLLGFPRDWRMCPSMPISSPPSTDPATGLFSTSRNSLASTFSECGGRWKRCKLWKKFRKNIFSVPRWAEPLAAVPMRREYLRRKTMWLRSVHGFFYTEPGFLVRPCCSYVLSHFQP